MLAMTRRLLKLKHEREDVGFVTARITQSFDSDGGWTLHVESPGDPESFHYHLLDGTSMSLHMTTREGDHLRGEAFVSRISGGGECSTVVMLAGAGPLSAF